jgi:hypothetical protein
MYALYRISLWVVRYGGDVLQIVVVDELLNDIRQEGSILI